jgi:hypothetical protein
MQKAELHNATHPVAPHAWRVAPLQGADLIEQRKAAVELGLGAPLPGAQQPHDARDVPQRV